MALPGGATGNLNGVATYRRGAFYLTNAEFAANKEWLGFDDETDSWGIYSSHGSPEGVVPANTGSICTDSSNGAVYIKTTDTVNTGWKVLATDAGSVDSVQGTANQVLVNGTSGSPVVGAAVLTTPQDIATTSSVTFGNVTLGNAGALRPTQVSGNTATIQVYNNTSTAYQNVLTLTNGTTPTAIFTASVGSATTPAYSFLGQLNYGMYYASNQTFLAANGTGWFSVSSGGVSASAGELRAGGILSNQQGRKYALTQVASSGVNNVTTSSHWSQYTNSAARTATMPSSSVQQGQVFFEQDGAFNAATNNLTMNVNGGVKTINGFTSLAQKANGASCMMAYDGTNYNILASHRMYSTALGRIVDKNGDGDFTTIQAAITAASSGQSVMVRQGTYTENLTMKAGVNVYADPSAPNGTVIISGKVSCSYAGTATIANIQLQTNSDFAVSNSGSSATLLYLFNCNVVGSNNVPIEYSNSNSSSAIHIYESLTNLTTTGIGLYTGSGTGTLEFNACILNNDGNSLTLPTFTAGILKLQDTVSKCPIQVNGGQLNSMLNTQIDTAAINVAALTLGTSGTHSVYHSGFASGTAAAISVGSGATLNGYVVGYSSSNATPIGGAGTINIACASTNTTLRNVTTTAADPLYTSEILGTQVWAWGINTSDNNSWVCSPNASVNRSNSSIVAYPTGPINFPNTPSVRAVKSASSTNATGDGTAVTLIWNTEIVDQNSNYNNATGVFTAPKSGNYHIGFTIELGNLLSSHTKATVNVNRSVGIGTVLNINPWNMASSDDLFNWNWSSIYDLAAGETLSFTVAVFGGTKTVSVDGNGTGITEFVCTLAN